MIPKLDEDTGRLPFVGEDAPYPATRDEIHDRFVRDTPVPANRTLLWHAFTLWHDLAAGLFPGSRYFMSGGFLTDRDQPSDVDVLLVFEPSHVVLLAPVIDVRARVLLTHQDVWSRQPPGPPVERMQPACGLVDGHLCAGFVAAQVAYWQGSWSTEFDKVTQQPTGVRMGYLEVTG